MSIAVVLSGGGTSGVAWEAGLLTGLRDGGVDLTTPDLFVGTSAGSVVGARLAAGEDVETIYRQQLGAPPRARPRDVSALKTAVRRLRARSGTGETAQLTPAMLTELGAMALAAKTETEQERLATVRGYLAGLSEWPERGLRITCVDVHTGKLVVWDRMSGVGLVEAVASSCAAPLVAPPTTINGRRYMDAGPLSATSAQLATGHDVVVILAVVPPGAMPVPTASEVEQLRTDGARVEALSPDARACDVIFPNPLDLSRRAAAAEAGYMQGRDLAAEAAAWMDQAASQSSG